MNTVSITTIEGHVKYDLYLSSKNRNSAFVDFGLTDITINPFSMLYKNYPDKHEQLIQKFSEQAISNDILFIGFSNSSAVFITNGKKYLTAANKLLKEYNNTARIHRIILTDKLEEKAPPHICPLINNQRFKYPPNFNTPQKKCNFENHLAIYYPLEPKKFYYPSKDTCDVFIKNQDK